MVFRTKALVILMMFSMIITPSSTEAERKASFKNRIFPEDKTLNENRPPNRTHPYGGTLVWGVANQPTIINPILTTHSVSAGLLNIVLSRLIRINSKGQIKPDLAKSWEVSDNGTIYTFYLRENVKFHDGVEFTAEDAAFTYQQFIDQNNNSPYRTHFELVQNLEVVDKYIFRITLSKPFPAFLYKLVEREIIPKHILDGKNLHNAPFNYHPIGTGPFKFKSWDKETNQIELEANTHYFEGRPYLDKIIVKTYSNNSQLWAAIMRHEVDLVQWITSGDYSIIEKDPAFKAYAVPFKMYYAMVYNLKDSIWHDQQLRQAIAYGINKKEIIDALPGFNGVESTGPFHPESIGFNPEVKPFEYDPIKAKMMLMHRGWQDMNTDAHDGEYGIRRKGDRELELRLLIDERNEMYKKMAGVIRQNLSEIGIKTKVLLYKSEQELTQEYLDRYRPQAWLRFYVGFGFSEFDNYDTTGNWYSLSSESGKLWDYKNDEVDRLYELARITQDENVRAEIYRKIHKIIYDDQPACFLFYPSWYLAVNAKFENTDEYFSTHMPTYTIKDWYMSKSSEM